MTNRRSIQEWVHWLEIGAGARLLWTGATILLVAILSVRLSFTQFRGPTSEATLAQAVVGRQLAQGHGFTTPVNFPQTAALLQKQGQRINGTTPFPELYQPPLYPLTIAAGIKALPESLKKSAFEKMPAPPDGFGGDYLLLGLNVGLLWLAAWWTFCLGRRLFDGLTGVVAMLALLLSSPVWTATVAVNGTPLLMVLLLGLFLALLRADEATAAAKPAWLWFGVSGVLCGLLFLTDYAAGVVIVAPLVQVFFRFVGTRRWRASMLVVLGFALVSGPWIVRNVTLTGKPLALAGQEAALKAKDPTADPVVIRTRLSTDVPAIDLNKLGNKTLTSLKTTFTERVWSGGGLCVTAFFIAGFLYRFRNAEANRLRWLFTVTILLLVGAQSVFDSGEGERLPILAGMPLMIVFGTGFFFVLVASREGLANHAKWAAAALLAVQALPLLHDVMEPRRLHFSYPPYYPGLFISMRDEMTARGGKNPAWMSDVPAGAAWYSGQRVWAQPAALRDFYAIGAEQPMLALVLTPQTLDKPFFSELTHQTDRSDRRLGEWAQVYAGLLTGRMPPGFPLGLSQKITDNIYVLIDPLAAPTNREK